MAQKSTRKRVKGPLRSGAVAQGLARQAHQAVLLVHPQRPQDQIIVLGRRR